MPFLDEASKMRAWAMQTTDSNVALVVVVDAGTGIVRAQRTFRLPPRPLEMARQGISRAAHLDERAAIEELAALSDQEVWEQGTRWEDKGDGVFTMVAEAPVLA